MTVQRKSIGQLLALVVHDLRNPTAAISANISFVQESEQLDDPDVREAIADLEAAAAELMRGLDQVAWIGRWLANEQLIDAPRPGDLHGSINAPAKRANVPIELPAEPIMVQNAGPGLTRLVEILLANCAVHCPGTAKIVGRVEGELVHLEIVDGGRAIAKELRATAFTLEGQHSLKGRGDGRYSRVAGLLSARLLADAIGAQIEAVGADGQAIFRITLKRA
jgi:signal transduction histidine kinase